jgi:N-acetylmuramoyl-L-alanine amidase
MKPGRRALLRQAGGLGYAALCLGASDLAFGASIVAVRVWPAADYTRITVESDTALKAQQFLTEAPARLVLDIEGLELTAPLRELVGKIKPDDPYVAGVRVGQFQPRVLRLVFDLKQAVAPQLFSLLPVAAYQHRLVLDLHPQQERDPLLALVREKQAALSASGPVAAVSSSASKPAASAAAAASSSQAAAGSVNDALGEWIGRLGERAPGSPAVAAAASAPAAGPPVAMAASAPRGVASGASTAAESPRGTAQSQVDRLIIVVLDPGHGGEDPGAIGPTGLREKDVALSVALQLRDELNRQPRMRAVLTRDADFFVPLRERVRRARRLQADLFVSIHADAFFRREARGASVFALSTGAATSATARWMAERENASDAVGGIPIKTGDAQVMQALLDMSTTAQIKDSLRLGGEVLGQLGRVGRLHKPRVEQAGFAVLKAPDIPSILVETAFISNPEEEQKLRDPAYQAELVQALANGIRRYFARNPPLARQRSV